MLGAIDNWLFLILVGIAALFRLLSKAAEGKRGPDTPDESMFPPPDQNAPRQPARSSEEEQIRKFLEALGQPRTAKPPPPLPPRTDIPARPVAPVQPPPSMIPVPKMRPAKRRGETVIPPALPKRIYEPVPPTPPPIEPPVFESVTPMLEIERRAKPTRRSIAQTGGPSERSDADLVQLLRTPGGLRQAFVLREILGPPRGVQPLQDLPGTA